MQALWFAVLFGWALQLAASDVTQGDFGAAAPPAKQQSPSKSKRNNYPFSGELESYSSASISLKGKRKPRILLLTPETRIQRNGVAASLKQLQAGDRVSGTARKNADSKEEALTVNLKDKRRDAK